MTVGPVVIDTSTVSDFVKTGDATQIISNYDLHIPPAVRNELIQAVENGHDSFEVVADAIDKGEITVARLQPKAEQLVSTFHERVSTTLGDGETEAFALAYCRRLRFVTSDTDTRVRGEDPAPGRRMERVAQETVDGEIDQIDLSGMLAYGVEATELPVETAESILDRVTLTDGARTPAPHRCSISTVLNPTQNIQTVYQPMQFEAAPSGADLRLSYSTRPEMFGNKLIEHQPYDCAQDGCTACPHGPLIYRTAYDTERNILAWSFAGKKGIPNPNHL